jgi:hypothetical protein
MAFEPGAQAAHCVPKGPARVARRDRAAAGWKIAGARAPKGSPFGAGNRPPYGCRVGVRAPVAPSLASPAGLAVLVPVKKEWRCRSHGKRSLVFSNALLSGAQVAAWLGYCSSRSEALATLAHRLAGADQDAQHLQCVNKPVAGGREIAHKDMVRLLRQLSKAAKTATDPAGSACHLWLGFNGAREQ